MKIGILSDAHGNTAALNSSLVFLEKAGAHRLFFLGDMIGYLPKTSTIQILNKKNVFCLLGNHDAMLLRDLPPTDPHLSVYGIKKIKPRIPPLVLRNLARRLPYFILTIDKQKILFSHGSPWDPLNGYVYPDSPLQAFLHLPFDIFFLGHTHRPFIKNIKNKLIVNVGSCGLPRDCGNLASCAMYDTRKREVRIFRLPFNEQILINKHKGLHQDVIDCLKRRRTEPLVGEVVNI